VGLPHCGPHEQQADQQQVRDAQRAPWLVDEQEGQRGGDGREHDEDAARDGAVEVLPAQSRALRRRKRIGTNR
jgi:hypothetical protein